MTDLRKTNLELPVDSDAYRALTASDRDTEKTANWIIGLRNAGWTLQSIAEPLGISRERVRQIAEANAGLVGEVNVPTPPAKAVRAKATYVEPTPEALETLLALQPTAQLARGPKSKHWADSEQYTQLLAKENARGVPVYRLAKRLNVTHGAIRFRLKPKGQTVSS